MVIPSPAQGAALRHLRMLGTDEAPMMAAHWLVESDSPALRRLAGVDGSEGWLIDQLWPEVIADLGVHDLSGERAWDLAMSFQLAAWRAGDRSVLEVMSQVLRAYIENDYPQYVPEAGHLYGLEDELDGGWGRTSEEVLADAERTLTEWAERRRLQP
ncbi:hypothetical protein [Nocardioides lijunqiniae]|uniref:hypothetical protein n=1 Tax=Nocardioides lijunqiniae TaxID=2760832 RepID=UPI001877C30C|nr:hypothetical protein [Nocardioides lijunqiniae]